MKAYMCGSAIDTKEEDMPRQINGSEGCPKCERGWVVDLRAKYGPLASLDAEWYCLNCGLQSYSPLPVLPKDASDLSESLEAA